MSVRTKHLYLVVLAQAVCVAVGLWMQHFQLRSELLKATAEQSRSQLETEAYEWLAEPQGTQLVKADADARLLQRVQALFARRRFSQIGVTLVDREWRRIQPDAIGAGTRDSDRAPGQLVLWKPLAPGADDPAKPVHGEFRAPDGTHLAVAYRLPDQRGYVLFHRPQTDVATHAQTLTRALPIIGLVTLLWTCALLSITSYLLTTGQHEVLQRERTRSSAEILRQTQTLVRTRDAVIFALGKLADSRDTETGDHLGRISAYSSMLAKALGDHPKFDREVTPAFVRLIGISSIPHDIGKVGIEDRILRKPGPLTAEERRDMQQHTVIAGDCLTEIAQHLGTSNFLEMAREIALTHHEHWDGNGYPDGLKGHQIPLAGRIVAIVDVYDALSSRRVYKEAMPHEKCVEIIRDGAGTQFDPDLVEVWLTLESQFHEISRRHAFPQDETAKPQDDPRASEAEAADDDADSRFVPGSVSEDTKVADESAAPL